MSCGNLLLQDPIGRLWILSGADDGTLIDSLSSAVINNFVAPIVNSPSHTWQLSALTDGTVVATVVSSVSAPTSLIVSSATGKVFSLSINDDGILTTNIQAGLASPGQVPYPIDVTMSTFPNLGLTSSVSGTTPLTVSADFSIWSCTLNRFINEDTTNIIVVLDE